MIDRVSAKVELIFIEDLKTLRQNTLLKYSFSVLCANYENSHRDTLWRAEVRRCNKMMFSESFSFQASTSNGNQ